MMPILTVTMLLMLLLKEVHELGCDCLIQIDMAVVQMKLCDA